MDAAAASLGDAVESKKGRKPMTRQKKEVPRTCDHVSYDLEGWEGGIAVYWMDGDHGTTIVAIPRLSASTCLLGNPSDRSILMEMLRKNKNFYYNRDQAEYFANLILRDVKGLKVI